MTKPLIHAEAHTDDYVIEAGFDAAPWFERATDDDILALAACGWGGDYAADEVAIGLKDEHDGLKAMFAYLDTIGELPLKKDCCGFECHVDEDEAMAWLKQNRPNLAAEIEREKEPQWTKRVDQPADRLRQALTRLLATPDLNLDGLEPETVDAIAEARAALGRAERDR